MGRFWQILRGLRTLRRMHQDARDILVSEIVCDAMYTIFFGGIRFTYDKDLSGADICPNKSKLEDISAEIKHRLGFLPAITKTERGARHLMNLLICNNLVFHGDKYNTIVYDLRNKISFPKIGEESRLSSTIRIFKNASRAHYSNSRRLTSTHHATYKRTVSCFFSDLRPLVAHDCASWLCKESALVAAQKAVLVGQLHKVVTGFEHESRL